MNPRLVKLLVPPILALLFLGGALVAARVGVGDAPATRAAEPAPPLRPALPISNDGEVPRLGLKSMPRPSPTVPGPPKDVTPGGGVSPPLIPGGVPPPVTEPSTVAPAVRDAVAPGPARPFDPRELGLEGSRRGHPEPIPRFGKPAPAEM